MLTEDQIPSKFKELIDDEISIYKKSRSITVRNKIPDTNDILIENKTHWLKIPNVICVYADMVGSTKLSATTHDNSTAGIYRLFTSTIVRLFSVFESPYIDIKGDGAFALFDSDQVYHAIASAITIKSFSEEEFVPRVKEKTNLEIGCRIGIDQKTILVRRIGFKRYGGRTDRQNEVWAGKTVNMSAKLSTLCEDKEIYVSERYFKNLDSDLVLKSCGCPEGNKVDLWSEVDLEDDDRFDFDKAFKLTSKWCSTHGKEYCVDILDLDNGNS